MVTIKFNLLLLITIFHVSHCERRIVDGEQVTSDKSYVVYLVKAIMSDRSYDSWLCGGALVSNEFIITSAACVEDVRYMYAIAGYRKYVHDNNLELDQCTKHMKKRIVYTCVPVSYEFDFDRIEKWAYIDIALAKVESPYAFDDARFELMCSYIPSIIPINYDQKRQASNMDAMVLGWGHREYWREKEDLVNYNQDYLRFASTTIFDKNKCQQEYKDYAELTRIIENYMICSMETGHLNDHGIPRMKLNTGRAGCITQEQKSMGMQGELCKVEHTLNQPEQALMNHLVYDGDETRRRMSLNEKRNNITNINVNGTGFLKGTDNDNGTDIVHGIDIVNGTNNDNGTDIVNATYIANGTDIVNETNFIDRTDFIYKPGFGNISGYFNRSFTRRSGICQNDHGGPLVTWVGKREVLIGIASVFKITEDNKCIGPFLYTSTVCNGAFIGCILGDRRANVLRGKDMSVNTSTALFCDSPPSVKGFDTIESYLSWKDHPAGPADNEKHTRGRLEANVKNDRYATNVKEKHDENTNDRFSLRIGLPPGMRPSPIKRHPQRKRPPPKRKPPPIIGSPQEMKPPSINSPPLELALPPITRPPPETEPPPIISPPLKMVPKPLIRAPPKMGLSPIIRPQPEMWPPPTMRFSPQMESPAFDEILNFKSEEKQPSSIVQPEIKIRPQSPLHG